MTIRDVVFRDIKTTTVTQMRDVHIRDKIIKDCILLGSPLTVGMFSSRIVSCLHRLDAVRYVTFTGLRFENFLRFGTLTLCAATFCNIMSCDVYVMLLYVM